MTTRSKMTSELQCYRFLWDQGEPLEAHHRFPTEGYEVVRAFDVLAGTFDGFSVIYLFCSSAEPTGTPRWDDLAIVPVLLETNTLNWFRKGTGFKKTKKVISETYPRTIWALNDHGDPEIVLVEPSYPCAGETIVFPGTIALACANAHSDFDSPYSVANHHLRH
jgi:hypothetical protein